MKNELRLHLCIRMYVAYISYKMVATLATKTVIIGGKSDAIVRACDKSDESSSGDFCHSHKARARADLLYTYMFYYSI